MAAAAKCSCIRGMSAIHGRQKKRPAEAGRVTGGNRYGREALLQPSPIDQAHVSGTQIEISREQRFDLFRLVALIRSLVHFHDSAEFLIRAGSRLTRQNEV